MTTATLDSASATRTAGAPLRPERLGALRLVRSELIKLTTLRSTWWSLGLTVVLAAGMALLFAAATRETEGGYPAIGVVAAPLQFTMLVAGIFGAMAITGEYSTGMIRSTLTAEPRRGAVLLAKTAAVTLLLAATALLGALITVVITAPMLGDRGINWSDAAASTIPLAYTVLAMVTFGLLGLGFGFLIRNGAGAIAATVGVLFVLPIILALFAIGGEAWAWVVDLSKYVPISAAQVLTFPGSEGQTGALITLLAWPAATLLAGWLVLRTRDA